jgi:hypothetical protein
VIWPCIPLACGNSLHSKRVASRPLYRVLAFTVRTSCYPLYFFSQPGGSNYTHPALALLAPEDFLHYPPLPGLISSEVPS